MATIVITNSLGLLILQLQRSGVLLKKHPRWSGPEIRYRAGAEDFRSRVDSDIDVPEELFLVLRKHKWIEEIRPNVYNWPTKKAFGLSDAGKAFHLPPPEFWMADLQ